ncbi:hypothetical protein vseg_011807 [Gypsophila vaccaria]
MSKPWGGTTEIGSWAAEAELAEAEERQAAATAAANPQVYPSLKESVTAKPKKKKMTLSEFYGSSSAGSGSTATRLTPDEMIRLPTGPKQRAPDEYVSGGGSRLGGGFGSYGGSGGGGGGGRRGGYDDMAPPPPPSRADEVDNWGAMKRSVPLPTERERGSTSSSSSSSRYGALGGGSRADEVDNWSFDKKPVPLPAFGNQARWGGGGDGGGVAGGAAGRPRLVLEPRSVGGKEGDGDGEVGKVNKASPFGAARPREEVLADKGLDWKKLDSEIEAKKVVAVVGADAGAAGSRPTSSQGSRPTSSQSNRSDRVAVVGAGEGDGREVRQRPKVNPFGDAKPREVLLEEKGLDWRKIDLQLEHRPVDRPETEEEKALKEEIQILKKDFDKVSLDDASQGSGGEQTNLRALIDSKEKDLETLTRELDNKIRFGQKPVDRPGSGAGRPGSGADRPPQSGPYDDYQRPEAMDRPRSRGTGDIWTRPGEDRRGSFQGNRDRGFMNNRDFNRSKSRERW